MTTPVLPLIDIEIDQDDWLDTMPDVQHYVRAGIEAAFTHMKVDTQLDIVVLLTDDEEMKALNTQFRQKNAPTNVLSFPAPEMMHPHLGDMALGLETCVKEARAQQKSLKDHVTHLCVHGALHLLGYDHMVDAEAEEMEALERTILKTLGIADPYSLNGLPPQ